MAYPELPAHNTPPLVNRVPSCGVRHVVDALPSLAAGKADYAKDAETAQANFHQLAAKVEALRAALVAMGIPV